ncbi:TraR/DksA C4-type zinc finger protein [Tessaracoccus sp. OS52]|uniref:TraR/DksA family transcriptional regulator n=1 Tax=Tessaracoccus sp. OS52 TaxID=2886691 RepID=UPI001D11D8F7|nr:TraR/DksA C4-type zinc finger protein [Tessaracoccus sp. OS52]MCC2593796.1 TraR/DksA C4-type zinc finger protein [Tessaracoccus sp. OS52]
MTSLDLAKMRAELNAKEADLRRSIERLTAPPAEGATIGFGKRIGEGTTQAIQQMADASSAQALNSTLDAVLRATAKLAEGTYGQCDVCGEPIDDDRLQFRPWSTRCMDHA